MAFNAMDQERFWVLLSRKLVAEATPAEEQELNLMLDRDPDYRARYDALRLYWEKKGHPSAEAADLAFQKTLAKIKKSEAAAPEPIPGPVIDIRRAERSGAGPGTWLLRVAAVLLFGLGSYFLYQQHRQQPLLAHLFLEEKQNDKGVQSKITLSDGSTVWLNGDSKLRFPADFKAGQNREVYLSGEAFFDVAKDSLHPFVIHLKDSRIKVLGTSFNVKAYEEDGVVETSVVTGKVAFIPKKGGGAARATDTLLLTANVKAIYSPRTGEMWKEETNSQIDKAWTENKLVFRATRLEEVGKALERTYGKRVRFANQELKHCRLTASFEHSSLEEVLYLLSRTRDYRYTISDREVLIDGVGCQPAKLEN
jgi:transmembrane sensor